MLDENGNEIPEVPAVPEPNGVERRIAELVGKQKDMENQFMKTVEQKDAQLAELLRIVSSQAAPAAKVEDPLDDLEPEVRQKFERLMAAQTAPLNQRLEQLLNHVESRFAQQEFQQVSQNEDPKILSRAQELMAFWRKQGKAGWVPQDAINYAAGEAYRAEKLAGHNRNVQNGFNAGGSGMLTGHGNQPPVSQSGNTYKRPADFDNLSASDRADILEKELGDVGF